MSLEKRRLNVVRLDEQDREGIHLLCPAVQDRPAAPCGFHWIVRCVNGCASSGEAKRIVGKPISSKVWRLVEAGLKACSPDNCSLRREGRTAPAALVIIDDDSLDDQFVDYSACRADHFES